MLFPLLIGYNPKYFIIQRLNYLINYINAPYENTELNEEGKHKHNEYIHNKERKKSCVVVIVLISIIRQEITDDINSIPWTYELLVESTVALMAITHFVNMSLGVGQGL